jgi:acid phosphatase (class A)
MRNIIACLGLVALVATLSAQMQNAAPKAPAKAQRSLLYLTSEQIDPSRLLSPPPKDGSEFQVKELAEVKRVVTTRTKERFAQAVWDAQHEDPTAFAAVLGDGFDLKRLPNTAKLLASVVNDQAIAASTAKEYFHRKVPVSVELPASYKDWSCDTVDRKPETRGPRSYPSGHATLGYSVGVVLSALMPEKSQVILARAADYAHSREVCGDHYHTDIEASHALGTAVGAMLLNNAALQPQIAAARAELRAAHLTSQ